MRACAWQDACNVGDEGGFAPNIQDNKEGLQLLVQAIADAGYTGKIKIGMDVAASEFYQDGNRPPLACPPRSPLSSPHCAATPLSLCLVPRRSTCACSRSCSRLLAPLPSSALSPQARRAGVARGAAERARVRVDQRRGRG